MTSSWGIYW